MVRSIDELPAIAQWSSVGSRMVLAVPFHCFTGLIIGGLVGRYTHWGQVCRRMMCVLFSVQACSHGRCCSADCNGLLGFPQSVWVKIVHILWLPIVLHGLYDFFLFLTTDEVESTIDCAASASTASSLILCHIAHARSSHSVQVFRKDLPFFAILGSLSSVCVFIAGVRALHILRCNNKEDCREDEGCGVA